VIFQFENLGICKFENVRNVMERKIIEQSGKRN